MSMNSTNLILALMCWMAAAAAITKGCLICEIIDNWPTLGGGGGGGGCQSGSSYSRVNLLQNGMVKCGGTYLGNGFILTAASCVMEDCLNQDKISDVKISIDSPRGDYREEFVVAEMKFHPAYCRNDTEGLAGNLALLKFNRSGSTVMLEPVALSMHETRQATELQIDNNNNNRRDSQTSSTTSLLEEVIFSKPHGGTYQQQLEPIGMRKDNIKRVVIEKFKLANNDNNNINFNDIEECSGRLENGQRKDYFCGVNKWCSCGPIGSDLGSGAFDEKGRLSSVLIRHNGGPDCSNNVSNIYAKIYHQDTRKFIEDVVNRGN